MPDSVLDTRLKDYAPANAIEQENALQELLQHYVLASLSRARFFAEALFHGGTCLRIIHAMNRFSEDLDFLLKTPSPDFRWQPYLERVQRDCVGEGIHFELQDKSDADSAVRKAFLKTDSIGKILILDLPFERFHKRKIRIKLEIDTNPPQGSEIRTDYITFPTTAALTTQSLESGFGLKLHALLCRQYVKGRDWYDLVWYVSRGIRPNLSLLANACVQQGPWAGQTLDVTPRWAGDALKTQIERIDWVKARDDVERFLPAGELPALTHWSTEFFLYQADKMLSCLA